MNRTPWIAHERNTLMHMTTKHRYSKSSGIVSLLALILYGCSPRPVVPSATAAAPAVGQMAKTFVLPGIDGKAVDVASTIGKQPVVLVFYRGNW